MNIAELSSKGGSPWLQLPLRIASKISGESECGCWIWGAAKTNGYGVVQFEGRVQRAHRVVYELLVKAPIPHGLQLDHTCRNRACVNPSHMEPVSGIVNNARSNSVSAKHARQTQCLRGHDLVDGNVYLRKRGHNVERFCRACCRIRDNRRYARRKSAREVEAC